MLHRTAVFEPSTWAEVEDAAASGKDTTSRSDRIIPEIISFTNCSARCSDGTIPSPTRASSLPHRAAPPSAATGAAAGASGPAAPALPPPPAARRHKRGAAQMDDLLGLGRVDLHAGAFARRYTAEHPAAHAVPRLPVRCAAETVDAPGEAETAAIASVLNPASPQFRAELYVSRLHGETPLEDLRGGRELLDDVVESAERDAAQERVDAHAKLALAAAVVDQARRSAHAPPGFSNLIRSVNMGASSGEAIRFGRHGSGEQFAATGAALDEKYRGILDRQKRIECLQHVLDVVRRFGWLLTLPDKLRAAWKADVAAVEEVASLLKRAKEWKDAQDAPIGPARIWIQSQIDLALDDFVSGMERRISHANVDDHANLACFVNILQLIGREKTVNAALNVRLASAREALLKVGAVSNVGGHSMRSRRKTVGGCEDMANVMPRLSNAFVSGLQNVWDLAQIVNARGRWGEVVAKVVPALVDEYTECVRKLLLSGPRLESRAAALEIGRAQRRAVRDVRVPQQYLSSLHELVMQVVDVHLSSLTRAVKLSAASVARTCFEAGTVTTQLPIVARVLVSETIEEARALVSIQLSPEEAGADSAGGAEEKKEHHGADGNLQKLAISCVRVPEFIVQTLRELVFERSRGTHVVSSSRASSSLRSLAASSNTPSEAAPTSIGQTSVVESYGHSVLATARCCSEFIDGAVTNMICDEVKGLVWSQALDAQHQSVTKRLRAAMFESVKIYTKRLCPEVRWSARRIVELRSAEGLRTSLSMEIDSASAQAVEVLLNVCLAVCRARQLGSKRGEVALIEKQLVEQVAEVLASSMSWANSTGSGTSDMAAQIWVDISFLMTVLNDSKGLLGSGKANDLFAQAQDMASTALRHTGVSFGAAEEETLRRIAIDPSVKRANLMKQAISGRAVERELPASFWVRNAMTETIRLAVDLPP